VTDSEYMTSAHIESGLVICGIPPRKMLSTLTDATCFNCDQKAVFRRFSGSGWYEDYWLCLNCGEDNGSGYRPFRRGWRKDNIRDAEEWSKVAISSAEFHRITTELIREEMGWE
jgi:hypothetical protein